MLAANERGAKRFIPEMRIKIGYFVFVGADPDATRSRGAPPANPLIPAAHSILLHLRKTQIEKERPCDDPGLTGEGDMGSNKPNFRI